MHESRSRMVTYAGNISLNMDLIKMRGASLLSFEEGKPILLKIRAIMPVRKLSTYNYNQNLKLKPKLQLKMVYKVTKTYNKIAIIIIIVCGKSKVSTNSTSASG